MARTQGSTTRTGRLATLCPRDIVEEPARRLGVVERRRKVDVYALVWALVLGFQAGSEQTLEALRTAYQRAARHSLARSALHDPGWRQRLRSSCATARRAPSPHLLDRFAVRPLTCPVA